MSEWVGSKESFLAARDAFKWRRRTEQAEREVEAWRPYKYDKELRTLVPEKCLGWLEALRAERDGLLRISEAQVEMYHHLETTLREARDLLEEATGYADTSGHYYAGSGTASTAAPLTESLLGRIIIFLQRTEGGE